MKRIMRGLKAAKRDVGADIARPFVAFGWKLLTIAVIAALIMGAAWIVGFVANGYTAPPDAWITAHMGTIRLVGLVVGFVALGYLFSRSDRSGT